MKVKLRRATKLQIILCFIGLSLLLYPSVSNYWNAKHATRAISTYAEQTKDIDAAQYRQIWLDAVQYNTDLVKRDNGYQLTAELSERYPQCLNVSGNGVMGYVEIPKLGVSLPIYHGTSDSVLQRAIGHLEWSSLPVGGESSHCVISGHRGLPGAKLFTDLDKLREGDSFMLVVMDETLTYEVDQIRTVVPRDVGELAIAEGRDYCTLVTCTPYGINTHRLLVRGHRVENAYGSNARVVSEAVIVEPLIVAPVVAFPFLFALFLIVMLKQPDSKARNKKMISSDRRF